MRRIHPYGCLAASLAMALIAHTASQAQTAKMDAPVVITEFDAPFTFSYLSWQDKIKVADGRAVLAGLKCDGGTGVNTKLDLAAHADKSPVLKLRTKEGNTAKTLKISLRDTDERAGYWEFSLPKPSEEFVVVTPKGGAALSKPNTIENKKSPDNPGVLDLAHLIQFQLIGDWSKDTLNVEVDAIVLVEPTAELRAQREAAAKQETEETALKAKKAAEEKERLAKEREQMIKSYGHQGEHSPTISHVSLAAPDIMAPTIEAQKINLPTLSKYDPQSDDVKKEEKFADGVVRRAKLVRGGKEIGWLQGRSLEWFSTYESYEGHPLLDFLAENAANYTVTSKDDAAYAAGVKPVAVHRKSMPTDWQQSNGIVFPMRHTIYLKLPSAIQAGKEYAIAITAVNVRNQNLTFKADLQNVRSDSVHVNQIGYRPDDPAKRAFLSVWLGTGGACSLPAGLTFSLLDNKSGAAAFSGNVERVMAADGTEVLWTKPPKNQSSTAVYRMDFSEFKTAGSYRVFVEGVGCSYPFEIGASVWEKAFLIQMRGLYHNRSGIELGPPYTDFKKPADFNVADGAVVTRTTYDALANGNESFADIVKGDTGETVKEAWGGYHDAGDWNPRRVTHMKTTLYQLEMVELYPAYFNALKLNIPPIEGVPDITTEALFEIDCFRRMQLPDGGIPYGIETNGDPSPGEMSWLSTQHAYVLAPNIRDSWYYAAAAGRAAKVLKPIKPKLAKVYEDSAVNAFNWAEADYAKRKADGTVDKLKELWVATDARNLSSLVLYDLTGDKNYHEIFLQSTCLKDPSTVCWWGKYIQCDAAFLYARLDDAKADPEMKKNAIKAVTLQADKSIEYATGNAFNLTTMDKHRPMFGGFFSTSGGTELARAHYLTGKDEYLQGALLPCQFQSGCNPNNIVYTTGLGANPVKRPLHLDSRSSGQPPPAGFTVFGNVDYWNWKGGFWDWPIPLYISKPNVCWPNPYDWPLTEAYFDIFLFVSMNEFVVDTWAPNVFVWGYLAARPAAPAASAPAVRPADTEGEASLLLLENQKVVLGVLPDTGAPVVLFRTRDGQNILQTDSKLWNKAAPKVSAEDPQFLPLNGHIYWLGPQKSWWVRQDVNPGKKTADSVKLKSPASPVSGIQLVKEIHLKDNKAFLKATATNIRDSEVSWDIWSNTRLPGDAIVYAPFSKEGGLVRLECAAWSPENDRVLPYTITDGFLNFDSESVAKDKEHAFTSKTFLNPPDGLLAAFSGGCLFLKKAAVTPKNKVHADHAFIEIFKLVGNTPGPLTELEMHGPYTTLKPGESMSFEESWELIPCKIPTSTTERINFLKEKLK